MGRVPSDQVTHEDGDHQPIISDGRATLSGVDEDVYVDAVDDEEAVEVIAAEEFGRFREVLFTEHREFSAFRADRDEPAFIELKQVGREHLAEFAALRVAIMLVLGFDDHARADLDAIRERALVAARMNGDQIDVGVAERNLDGHRFGHQAAVAGFQPETGQFLLAFQSLGQSDAHATTNSPSGRTKSRRSFAWTWCVPWTRGTRYQHGTS